MVKMFVYFKSKLALVLSFLTLLPCTNTFANKPVIPGNTDVATISPYTNASVIKPGFWETDVAVICNENEYEQALRVIKSLCVHPFAIEGSGYERTQFLKDFSLSSKNDSENLQAFIVVNNQYILCVNFVFFKTNELYSGSKAEEVIKKCLQAMIFYDVDRSDNDKFIEELKEKAEFLVSFDWNNTVDFINRFYNPFLKRKIFSKDPIKQYLSGSITVFQGNFEHKCAYVRHPDDDNRWHRTHSGSPSIIIGCFIATLERLIRKPLPNVNVKLIPYEGKFKEEFFSDSKVSEKIIKLEELPSSIFAPDLIPDEDETKNENKSKDKPLDGCYINPKYFSVEEMQKLSNMTSKDYHDIKRELSPAAIAAISGASVLGLAAILATCVAIFRKKT